MVPFTDSRTGAVYTSPSGIFIWPAHGIAGIPLMEKVMSVPGPVIRTRSVRFISYASGSIARAILE